MNKEQLKLLHAVQLDMMDDVHSLCVKNNIRYYLIAGTALGAVRHGGIIPWDIDIDIAMPRSDYKRFLEEYAHELEPRYKVLYYKNKNNIDCPHALITLLNSNVVFNSAYQSYGIYIDLFPLDTCPDEEKLRVKQAESIKKIKLIDEYKHLRKGKNLIFSILRLLIYVLLLPLTHNSINKIRDRIMTRYSNKENTAKYWCSMASKYKYNKQCMTKDFYGKPTLMNFSDRQYFVPEKITDYLYHLYGDYMKLPSEDTQQKQMGSILYAEWKNSDGKVESVGKKA